MYNEASEQFNTLITAPGRTFRARLLVGDEVLEGISSVKLTNGSNNGDALTLGSTISQMATITMENPGIFLSGKEFALQIGLKLDEENIEYIPMGVFVVDKSEIKANKLSITAYDRIIKLSAGYISALPDETDTISVLNEMAQLTGVPISTEGLEAISIVKPVGYTYRETLMYISQLYGGFANASRDGIIEIHAWEDTGHILEADMGINGFVAGETYTVNRIACETEQNEDEDGESIIISSGEGTGIGITNPFMTQEILDEIYEKMKGFTYDVVGCPVILGDPRLEPWDIITINSAAGTTHKVPLMVLEYVYDGGLSMTITSTCSTESEESFDYKGPMERLIEQLVSKVGDAEKELYSEIAQTNKSISLMVKKDDLIAQINLSDGVIKLDSNRLIVNSDNFKLSGDGTLEAVNGKFKGTITGSSGEFTEGFKVKVLDWTGSPFLCEVRSGTEEENSKFIIEYQSRETSALSQLIIQDGTVNMYASTNVNIESDKYVDIYGVFGITVRTRELTIDNVGTNTRWAKFNEDGTYLYGNVKVDSGTLTVNDTKVSLDGHTHNSLYNTVLDESIKFVADGDYGFFRPTTASLVYCGSSARPWYKVFTERLEVLSARPILQPVYDNTVSYATNCYISSAGLLSRTTNTSSRTIKHDVKSITGAEIDPEKLYDITVYQFKYNEDILTDKSDTRYGKDLPGFIIEELVEQYPIAVDRPTDNVREWSWNAQYLIPGMLKLIQDQHKSDHKMEQEIATQKARIEQLAYQAQQLFDKVARQQAIIDGLA